MIRTFFLVVFLFWLTACANRSTVIIGTAAEEIDFRDVEVFYTTSPVCEFEVVALIEIPGEHNTRASLIDDFRAKAAAVGAPAVQISYVQKTGANDYFGSARAIRCISKKIAQ